MNKKRKYKLNYLSADFYAKYNNKEYPEIENKESRPYAVILLKLDNNTFAIPFRTNIKHNNCYKFKNSTRTTSSVTGLDFTKAVVISKKSYIGESARINDKEYDDLDANFHIIIRKFENYLNGYIKFASGHKAPYNELKYKYTTLRYFHNELNIK